MSALSESPNTTLVYEVNLTIEKKIFHEHKDWLIQHFHEMVIENQFTKLNLFYVRNMDPTNDEHMRYQKIVAQYFISHPEILARYFEKQAKSMRNQVIEKLGSHYTVTRRVFEWVECFEGES